MIVQERSDEIDKGKLYDKEKCKVLHLERSNPEYLSIYAKANWDWKQLGRKLPGAPGGHHV